ncbi:hypothetical protein WJX72_003431 [[Myrmecia] bisecta]|uniref:RNA helicase n=1 Tax=[Myrmecia] bisecta TaxID=41462 RepID=A0AAW1Q6W4_9CHLO
MADEQGGLQLASNEGGLLVRNPADRHVFKAPAPRLSILGLDALARQKRIEQGKPALGKRPRLALESEDAGDDGSGADGQPGGSGGGPSNGDKSAGQRHYRGQRIDTPSHPGGVNERTCDAIADRKKDRAREGVYASTARPGEREDGSGSSRERERDSRRDEGRSGNDKYSRKDRDRDGRGSRGPKRSSERQSDRERSRHRDTDRGRGARERPSSERGRSSWEAGTPSRRSGYDEWESTPSRGRDGSAAPSPWERRGGDTPQRMTTGRSTGSSWDYLASPAPSPVRAGSGKGASVPRPRSSVRFEVEPSPVITPSWQSNSWNKKKTSQSNGEREPSPELRPDGEAVLARDENWQQAEKQVDRDWYDQEEGGGGVDETHNPFVGDEQLFTKRETEMQKKMTRRDGSKMSLMASKRASELQKDMNAWEENRMMQSGVVRAREVDIDFDNDDDTRVLLLVHDPRPPFLDAKYVLTKQAEPVLPIRDPTSDMAKIARQGSKLVMDVRQQKEQNKSRQRFWEVAGSKMAKITGMTEGEKAEEQAAREELRKQQGGDGEEGTEDDLDYKAAGQFRTHLKKQEAVSEFARTNTMAQQRRFLPVYDVREELLQVIRENQVVVVVGETGSGKTTQMTQYLHEDGYTNFGIVGCTQPRRVAAMSVAKRVSEEMGVELGEQVGYAIRFEDCTGPETLIKYMTDGVLLRETLREDDLDQYSAIIMDEAHERSLNTDVLFGILRKVVSKRRDFRLIVTSATLDSKKFADFFGSVPVYAIPGRTFPVEVMFSKTPQEDYVEAAVKQAIAVHLGHPAGDILIFMTGQEEIEATCFSLQERLEQLGESVPELLILPIYSQLPSDLQAKIFEKAPEGARKCIVSTNIAETSLTVDGILYVIDTGYCKLKVYNPKMGMDALQVFPCSQAASNQRSGRAGRTGPGTCWRLFTETAFRTEMLETTVPEIQRTNLGNVVLLLKSLNVGNLMDFPFMDPPPQDNMANSMYQLWVLGALDNTGELTPLGRKMVEFPLDPPLAKMLLVGSQLGCANEVLTVVSMLSVPGVFFRPPDRAEESDAAREKFFVPESDHLTMLHVYQQWKQNNYRADWCNDHFLQAKGLRKAKEVRQQLLDIMEAQKVVCNSAGSDWDTVRKAICSSYFHNAAKIKGIGEYVNCRTGMPCFLHPSSALYGLGYTPDYIVYHELVFTSKEYMQCVTAVEPEWLAELGPTFFSIKESHTSRLEQKKKEKLAKSAMQEEMLGALATKAQLDAADQKAAAALRDKQRSAIATPGMRTPLTTPRRKFGL